LSPEVEEHDSPHQHLLLRQATPHPFAHVTVPNIKYRQPPPRVVAVHAAAQAASEAVPVPRSIAAPPAHSVPNHSVQLGGCKIAPGGVVVLKGSGVPGGVREGEHAWIRV